MQLADPQCGAEYCPTADANGTRLRIKCLGVPDQFVDLRSGKTMIGSSPRCNVRIVKPGVHPLHLLILNDADGPIARRWAADTRLNGALFDEAPLSHGDCLSVGTVEIEVAHDNSFPTSNLTNDNDSQSEQDGQPVTEPRQDVNEACESLFKPIAGFTLAEESLPLCEATRESTEHAPEPSLTSKQSSGKSSRSGRRKVRATLRRNRTEYRRLAERVEDLECLLQAALAVWDAQHRSYETAAPTNDNVDGREQLVDVDRPRAELPQHQSEAAATSVDDSTEYAAAVSEVVGNRPWQWPSDPPASEPIKPTSQHDSSADHAASYWSSGRNEFAASAGAAFDQPNPTTEPAAVPEFDWSTAHRARTSTPPADSHSLQLPLGDELPQQRTDRSSPWGETPADQSPAGMWHTDSSAKIEQQGKWPVGGSDGRITERRTPQSVIPAADAEAEPSMDGEFVEPGALAAKESAEFNDDLAAFSEFSIWKQGAEVREAGDEQKGLGPSAQISVDKQVGDLAEGSRWSDATTAATVPVGGHESQPLASIFDGDVTHEKTPDRANSSPPAALAVLATNSESFIERYAHLFAEEGQSAEERSPDSPAKSAQEGSSVSNSRPVNVTAPAAVSESSGDDEETIEQYMAKLLQRVRGESTSAVLPLAKSPPDRSRSAGHSEAATRDSLSKGTPQASSGKSEPRAAIANEEQVTTSLGTVRRKPAVAEQPADREAFRAVANESARRAISTHSQRVHRRKALTKAIVATLAGVTSVWLMLVAPNWLDVQFISACVALIVAAYWAGQSSGEFIEAIRAGYGGKESASADPFHPPLPIDVKSEG